MSCQGSFCSSSQVPLFPCVVFFSVLWDMCMWKLIPLLCPCRNDTPFTETHFPNTASCSAVRVCGCALSLAVSFSHHRYATPLLCFSLTLWIHLKTYVDTVNTHTYTHTYWFNPPSCRQQDKYRPHHVMYTEIWDLVISQPTLSCKKETTYCY